MNSFEQEKEPSKHPQGVSPPAQKLLIPRHKNPFEEIKIEPKTEHPEEEISAHLLQIPGLKGLRLPSQISGFDFSPLTPISAHKHDIPKLLEESPGRQDLNKPEEKERPLRRRTQGPLGELRMKDRVRSRTPHDERGGEIRTPLLSEKRSKAEDVEVLDKPKKESLWRRIRSWNQQSVGLPFDAYVDSVKGGQPEIPETEYPSYKIDKRLIFLGKPVQYPWHIISYHSRTRKIWNLFLVFIMLFQVFWYPIACTFIYGDPWPVGAMIFECFAIVLFFLDMIINMRTTYSNENNEEIIEPHMTRRNYLRSTNFLLDLVTTLPIQEVLLIFLFSSDHKWEVYSILTMLRMLRVFKIFNYMDFVSLSIMAKLLRIFITLFMAIHWASCFWYMIVQAQHPEDPSSTNVWIPNNQRMITDDNDELLEYYNGMDKIKQYSLTLLSVFMIAIGSEMVPVTRLQIWFSVILGLFGAVSMAYIFALVTLVINRAYRESAAYSEQLEDLKHKLKVNKIPQNLKIKVMEYFHYTWRKHNLFMKTDDFSELSIPLQRDIVLHQHQEMLTKVPLFKDLDPIETLSIVQKLKTAVYMPGDRIIREGERGTDMYFIQEGVVEILMRKSSHHEQVKSGSTQMKFEKFYLEKGGYFGEVALLSNSKRSYSANSFEFCILYTFTRSDYESLRKEFKDIGPRLRSGLKHYKNTHMNVLIQSLHKLNIFEGFTDTELQRVADEYLEEYFVDPDRVILDPKERINAMYVIFAGTVSCYDDSEETRNYLNNLKRSKDNDNWTVVDMDEPEDEIECLDDEVLRLEKDELSIIDDKKKLRLEKTYTHGDYFGTLDFEFNEIKCTKYFVSETGCQIGIITQMLVEQMEDDDPNLYEKLKNNMQKYAPPRVVQEESSSSESGRGFRTVLSRKMSIFSDVGKKPALIRTGTQKTRKDDYIDLRESLYQLEEDMAQIKNLIIDTNTRMRENVSRGESPKLSPTQKKEKLLGKFLAEKAAREAAGEKQISATLPGVSEEEFFEEKTQGQD